METCPSIDEELKKRIKEAFPVIVLASQSPNRLAVLSSCGISVTARAQDIDEICGLSEPEEVVRILSFQKMKSYVDSCDFDPTIPAVSADTLVCIDNRLLGKPSDEKEARAMYRLLSGRAHSVLSGVTMYIPSKGIVGPECDKSDVFFKNLSGSDIDFYISTGDYRGVAGGYRIQSKGYLMMEKISGSLSNIIGLPLELMLKMSDISR